MEDEGGTPSDYIDLMNKIGFHESGHTMDPFVKQIGGGPGRGRYQFEVGKNKGGITAARRLKNFYDYKELPTPKWLKDVLKKNSLDASTLTPSQQDMLLLGNLKMGKGNLEDYFKGDISLQDLWSKYHWSGKLSDKQKKIDSFNESMSVYDPEEINAKLEEYREPSNENSISEEIWDTNRYLSANVSREIPQNEDLFSYINKRKEKFPTEGGDTQDSSLNEYNVGGTHEQNPHGGIPQGTGANGQPNTVEQGETSFKLPLGKFVFSDRISTNGQMQPKLDGAKQQVSNSYNKQFAYGGNMGLINNYFQTKQIKKKK